jgi:hypothetical protein
VASSFRRSAARVTAGLSGVLARGLPEPGDGLSTSGRADTYQPYLSQDREYGSSPRSRLKALRNLRPSARGYRLADHQFWVVSRRGVPTPPCGARLAPGVIRSGRRPPQRHRSAPLRVEVRRGRSVPGFGRRVAIDDSPVWRAVAGDACDDPNVRDSVFSIPSSRYRPRRPPPTSRAGPSAPLTGPSSVSASAVKNAR